MKKKILSFLRLSERPDPPPGSDASLVTFRASRRYLYYTIATWVPKQISGFVGLLFSLFFFRSWGVEGILGDEDLQPLFKLFEQSRFGVAPGDLEGWFYAIELVAVAGFLAQMLLSGTFLKLSWELRWYMVGDECLRIREGLWSVREKTMTIANIQNMTVRQGPLQRFFDIADLEVQMAGGGGAAKTDSDDGEGMSRDLSMGRFRGLENARELRERIRARLHLEKGAGLGDLDEAEAEPRPQEVDGSDLAGAARELRDEIRGLRRTLRPGGAIESAS